MLIPKGALVVVVDGEKANTFRNSGTEADPKLAAVPIGSVTNDNHGSGGRHHASSANPDHGQLEEDSHAAGVAALLNAQVAAEHTQSVIVVASPRTLGELRKHYSKQLSAAIVGEISKDLTGHSAAEIEKAIVSH